MNVKEYNHLKSKNNKTIKLFHPTHKECIKLKECSNSLFISVYQNLKDKKDIKTQTETFTCKSKFCSVCEKKKSNKIHYNLLKVLNELRTKHFQRFLFLTLTVRNCKLDDLKTTVKEMNTAYNKFKTNLIKNYDLKGFFKKLEITYKRLDDGSIECHPHFHIILSFHINHFKHNNIIPTQKYVELWKKSLKVDYTPICDVRTLDYNNLNKSLKEITKYITKDSDLQIFDKFEIAQLVLQLKGLRFYSSGKSLKVKTDKIDLDDSDEFNEYDYELILEVYYRYINNNFTITKTDDFTNIDEDTIKLIFDIIDPPT